MPSFIDGIIKNFLYSSNIDISTRLFIGLILLGCIIKLLTSIVDQSGIDGGIGEATGTIWGYFIILFSVLGLVIIKLDSSRDSTTQIINNEVGIPWYLYGLCGIVILVIYLNITYYKVINQKNVPPSYLSWNWWSTVFIFFITILMIGDLTNTESRKGSSSTKSIFTLLITFILFLNFIITGIQQTILQNFTVDG
jgi:hypothetical protein